MSLSERLFDNADALNTAFAQTIAEALSSDIRADGEASLIVSGGRTPVGLFQTLSQQNLDWNSVKVTLADERWVDESDAASNTQLVKTHLLQNHAAAATFVAMKTDHDDAYEAQSAVEKNLSSIKRPFSVVILGMGEDGHTASLFPCSAELEAGTDPENTSTCLAVTPTTAPHQRMSLTLNAIVESSRCFVHLVGDKKKQVLHEALAETSNKKPIASVIERTDVTLFWAP